MIQIQKWPVFVFCFFLLAAACSHNDSKHADNDGKADSTGTNGVAKKENKAPDIKAVPVEVTTIAAGEISSYVLTNASLETEEAVDIFPQVTGIVVKLRAEEGQYVKKGEVLLAIDEREYKLREEAARVNYERQKNSYERSKNMFDKKLLSESEFEVANFNLEQARIEWEQAKLTLDYCNIKAPISGFISERTVKLGDRLLTSTKVYSIVNPDLLRAKIHLTEKDALLTRVGQRAEIVSEALPGQTFTGVVDIVSPVVDPSSGMVRVTIRVMDRQRLLKPGMFVNVHLITDTKRDAVLIPKKAVVYDDNQQFVYVVRRDTLALKVPLKPGYADRDRIEALEGINIGDTIIVVGHSGMKDSTKVKIAELKS
ncbi:MAG: efflux RND transporter periplasmic adaptor subunit [candidate division KSB1 bacterium]|nr:efflux RND transporter periplasmic adaptor subunit [candidate division KSB1 bacterium]MDZ7367910.1 efflux RND transporter periplasmic adaptor subunit [candidate division KSB1 bacterium]MDZ7406523.1 efflux RND transporter periplasmic adaptor subunit [candidate division KSB1 bacterium]